jgi:hypothetical protein
VKIFVSLSQNQKSFLPKNYLVAIMAKNKDKPDFKPTVPFVPEKDKDNVSGEKPVALSSSSILMMVLQYLILLRSICPCFIKERLSSFFKWVTSITTGHTIRERYSVASKA